ncbi:hypothetical protein F4604DRAFT_1768284 [Suillus subluteus]|nr:hypothetical protein F4604DRAFT_1768284 [Suillus subluteus]
MVSRHKETATYPPPNDKNGKKYNIRWFHIGATNDLNKLNNSFYHYANCLRENHRKNKNCSCEHCISDRTSLGCAKPFKCKKLAEEILKCIQPKWHPGTKHVKFNPDSSTPASKWKLALKTTSGSSSKLTQHVQHLHYKSPPPDNSFAESITAIIDSSYHVSKDGEHVSGAGAWFNTNDDRNVSIKLPDHLAAPGAGEIGAVLHVARTTPKMSPSRPRGHRLVDTSQCRPNESDCSRTKRTLCTHLPPTMERI